MKNYLSNILNSHSYFASIEKVNFQEDILLSGVTSDSREVRPGYLFVATKGATENSFDGHDYIDEAIIKGASAIVLQRRYECKIAEQKIPYFIVNNSAQALGFFAEGFYGWPSKKITVIGITGTNGKTSTSFLLYSILKKAGKKVKIMGTLGIGEPENLLHSTHTTMPSVLISKNLYEFSQEKTDVVIMEVSSHALSLFRVDAIQFAIAGITNITQDHLDFHKDMESYKNAKKRFFTEVCDEHAIKILPKNIFSHLEGVKNITFIGDSTSRCEIVGSIDFFETTTKFNLRILQECVSIILPLAGNFQAHNAMLAACIANLLLVTTADIKNGLAQAFPVSGRMQLVKEAYKKKNIFVMIDYAHTPDALLNLFQSAKKLAKKNIIIVFGCGGDRDSTKRKIMGEIADNYADEIIITDDNPRNENSQKIRDNIAEGILKVKFTQIPDRFLAIKQAVEHAKKDDIVLVAGKGHENYQIYGEEKKYFNDYDAVVEIVNSL